MPNRICPCGHVFRLGVIPCPDQWLLISDVDFDRFDKQIETDKLFDAMILATKCPDCGRLWIYYDGFGGKPTEYVQVHEEGG